MLFSGGAFFLYVTASLFACTLLVSACTLATSRSWFHLWSWRAMRPCGLRQSASTKYESPSARIQSWRCAPRAWVHRQKHCGSVTLFRFCVVTVKATNCSIFFSFLHLLFFPTLLLPKCHDYWDGVKVFGDETLCRSVSLCWLASAALEIGIIWQIKSVVSVKFY